MTLVIEIPCEQCNSCSLYNCCSSLGSFMPFEDTCPAYEVKEGIKDENIL